MMGKLINRFTLGLGVGYILGARAGRGRYEQIMRWWDGVTGTPAIQKVTEQGKELAGQAAHKAQEVGSRIPVVSGLVPHNGGNGGRTQTIAEVMTAGVQTAKLTDTVAGVAETMRDSNIGSVIVIEDQGDVCGIVTDRDIAVRAVAEGKPATATIADIVSRDTTTVSPDDSVASAVKLMRERAIRRLPVVRDGRPVGVVSLGDLAVERDRSSALADISAAPANS